MKTVELYGESFEVEDRLAAILESVKYEMAELQEREDLLFALEVNGVELWEGYDAAQSMLSYPDPDVYEDIKEDTIFADEEVEDVILAALSVDDEEDDDDIIEITFDDDEDDTEEK